jgi:RNA polymerase sigma factor (TIGR02999 family)
LPWLNINSNWFFLGKTFNLNLRTYGWQMPLRNTYHRHMQPSNDEITLLIGRWRTGDSAALSELLPQVYAQLRSLAGSQLRGQAGTLQPTALVHEVVLRFLGAEQTQITDSKHFFTTAAKMMRQVLCDYARHKARDKHGGGWQRVELPVAVAVPIETDTTSTALHEALAQLELLDPRMAQIVELRYFAGLEVSEVATLLELDERTVYRDWAMARAWLKSRIGD